MHSCFGLTGGDGILNLSGHNQLLPLPSPAYCANAICQLQRQNDVLPAARWLDDTNLYQSEQCNAESAWCLCEMCEAC